MKSKAIVILVLMSLAGSSHTFAQKSMEIISKRTWNSKTYLNEDNTMTIEVNSGYVHYRDRFGQFQDIDRRVVPSSDSSRFEVSRGLYQATFGFDLQSNDYPISFMMEDGTRFRAKLTSLAYYNRASKQMVTLQNVQNTTAIVNGNKIRYPGAFNGIDVEFEYLDTKLKQHAYLSQKARDNLPDPQSFGLNPNNTDLVLLTQIDLPDSLDAFVNDTPISTKPQGKIRLAFEGEDGVEFRNTGGKLKFLLPADFAFATAGGDSASEESSSRRMWRRFYSSGNDNLLLTGVPVKWLHNQSEGTIVLDPTVSLSPPTDDVWIESDDPLINYNSYAQIRIGRGDGFGWKRSLVRFDVSAIPSNATIDSAKLRLYFYGKFGTNIINRSIQCHQVLQQWNQTQATWNNRLNSTPWGTPGVGLNGIDAKATPEDTKNWYNEYPNWKSYNLTALTQQWVNGSQTNYGVIFWATDEDDYTNGDEKWVYSSEYTGPGGDTSQRPKLVVTLKVNPLVDITYDALSRPTTITYANGVAETNQYDDNRGWLKRRDYQKSGSNIYYFKQDLATDYDKAGNLKHVEYKYLTTAAQNMNYAYNNRLYRITQFDPGAKTYTYDPNGNLKSYQGQSFRYSYHNNQLSWAGADSFRYDAAGRMTQRIALPSMVTTNVSYDFRSSMVAYGSNTYSYDAFGQRVRKTEGGVSKYYVTSGPQVLAEYSNNSGPDAEYIYALGRMVSKFEPAKGHSWLYVDHLGSSRLVDGSDEVPGGDLRRDYYPFGQNYYTAGNNQTAYQFTQKGLDDVTELYYFGARYYDRKLGRWLTPDPIMSEFSSYSYVHNRPLMYIDRLGLAGELPPGYEYIDVPAFMFWDNPYGPFGTGAVGAGGGGGIGSYPSGGRWERQTGIVGYTSVGAGYWQHPITGKWLPIPGTGTIAPVYGDIWVWQGDPDSWQGYGVYSREYLERIAFNTPPMRNTAPNPYDWKYHYWGVSARLMFWYGGNGRWGQIVRGSLVEFHELGVDPAPAHEIAYEVADQRTAQWETIKGRGNAYFAAASIFFFEYVILPKLVMYMRYPGVL